MTSHPRTTNDELVDSIRAVRWASSRTLHHGSVWQIDGAVPSMANENTSGYTDIDVKEEMIR
jgi:hypothetical protein